MGMEDGALKWSTDQTVSADGNSTNLLKLPSARKLFGGFCRWYKMKLNITAVTGTPTLNTKLVGATSSDLSTGAITILETGAQTYEAGKQYEYLIPPQSAAKDHYGLVFDITGTTSVTLDVSIVETSQTNLLS